jgi:hypothetical protein
MSSNLPTTPITGDTIYEMPKQAFLYNQSPEDPTSFATPYRRKQPDFGHAKSEVRNPYLEEAEAPRIASWLYRIRDGFMYRMWNEAIHKSALRLRIIYCVVGVIFSGIWVIIV